jgi:hypothetical protein
MRNFFGRQHNSLAMEPGSWHNTILRKHARTMIPVCLSTIAGGIKIIKPDYTDL